jgi:hypothetical protein
MAILTHQERIDQELAVMKGSREERQEYNQKKVIYRDINRFISSLRLPCYAAVKYYYYYDILEGLSRRLFQQLLTQANIEY